MIELIEQILTSFKWAPGVVKVASLVGAFVVLVILSWLANVVAKRLILNTVAKLVTKSKTNWDDILLKTGFFKRVAHLAPAIVLYFGVSFVFSDYQSLTDLVQRLCMAVMIITVILACDSLLSSLVEIYRQYDVSKNKPIKSYVQVAKVFVYVIAGIFIISTLLDKSPWALFGSIGAMTAVIMLVFKDTILGFVASIQLAAHNMIQRGDWVEMPKYGADGDVIDISLNTIKIQNWDKTISTVPTYAFISDSFKNWRGMSESEGRRIKRSLAIDMNSIRFCDQAMLDRLKKIGLLQNYLAQKEEEIAQDNQEKKIDSQSLVNGRRLTNVGTFRAYIIEYLKNHRKIHQNMTFLVRQLAPTDKGLPIEIYVFSNDQEWVSYESIQADIFDHIIASLKEFDLQVFQNPTGTDFQQLKAS